MGLRHWVGDTYADLREDPSLGTAEIALRKFWAGALGRFGNAPSGTVVWDDDWDVLVILDGCRLDTMREVAGEGSFEWLPKPSDIDGVWSVGSTSDEWLGNTFDDDYEAHIGNTACVTGNPYMSEVDTDSFAELLHVATVETDYGITTVPPRSVTDPGIDVWRRKEELDIDRLILHYMQPHAPFRSRPGWFSALDDDEKFGSNVWWRLCDGSIDADEFWEAYADNLRWVLDDLAILRQSIDGRIRVTADHGNAAGERGIFGHPEGVPVASVRQVPWFRIEGEDTGEYEPELTGSDVRTVDSRTDVEAQLEALGYT